MPFKYNYLACVIFAIFGIARAVDDHKVDVTIFYETLDQPSIKFFTDNFKANTSDLLKFIDIHLVPFGKTQLTKAANGSLTINCQHGDIECFGNQVHACAVNYIQKPEDLINFIVCTMKYSSPNTTMDSYPLNQCFESLNNQNYNLTVLETCARTKNKSFVETYENMTRNKIGTTHDLPAIILGNDPFDANSSNILVKNFHDVLCQRLANTTSISAICPNVTSVIPGTAGAPITPETPVHTTTAPGSATINSVTYLPLVLATIVFLNLKFH